MHFRKITTATLGAATAGVMVASSLSSAAVAALPSTAPYAAQAQVAAAAAAGTGTADFTCAYQSWDLDYSPEMVAVAEDGQVRLSLSDFGGIDGVPAFVTVSKVVATVTGTYGGQEVSLTGEVVPETAGPLADGFPMPTLVADAPEGVNGGALVVTGLAITMTAFGSANDVACTMTAPATLEVAPESGGEPEPEPGLPTFQCAYQSWDLDYSPEMVAVAEDGQVRLSLSDFGGIAGPPAFVTVSKVVATVTGTYGGQEVSLTGEVVPEAPGPLAEGFPMPTLVADAPEGVNGGDLVVTGLAITMTALGSANDVACTMPAPVTLEVAPEGAVDPGPDPDTKVVTETATQTARYDRAARVLDVEARVSTAEGVPAGQVRIEVKRRDNVVRTAVVDLDQNGAAARTFRQFKGFAIGNVVVEVSYLGNETHEVSTHSLAADKAPKAATSTTVYRASYARATRVLHVRGQVVTESGLASNPARVIVKRRGNVVRSRLVEVTESGEVRWGFRDFNGFKKGRVRVVIRYTGDPANQRSRDAVAADKKG